MENNATFCGSGGPAGRKQETGVGRVRCWETLVDENEKSSGKILFGAVFVFVGGYLVGRLTSGRKGLKKRE